jgi:SHS2 domain-containing protein
VSWRTFEHQADLGLEVEARGGPELFAEAALALYATVCDLERVRERRTWELAGEADDVEALLVDWLNGVIFLFEAEAAVCRRVEFPAWSETAYRAVLHGELADPARHALRDAVKAATYHGLSVAHDEAGWRARVILDV